MHKLCQALPKAHRFSGTLHHLAPHQLAPLAIAVTCEGVPAAVTADSPAQTGGRSRRQEPGT
jgi:hypothetical protein